MRLIRTALKGALLASTALAVPGAVLAQEGPIEEVVVLGRFIPDEKRDTSEISNVIDADDFARTGDSDIAAALQRVTGLSLVGSKFVYVRGLGERYSSALLDGASLPSPEPLRRVVPLDIFPTALLGGSLVQKTYSVEYPAEFGGGVIALRTKTLPEEQFFTVALSGGYNTESTFKKGLTYDGGDFDWLGVDDGFRDFPAELARDPELENSTEEQREAAGEALPNVWSIDREPNIPDVGLDLTYGDRFDFSDWSLGLLTAINYDAEIRNKVGQRNTWVASNQGLQPNDQINPQACDAFGIDGCGLRTSELTVGLNGFLSLGAEINNNHTLKYTTMLLRNTTKEAAIEQGEFAADPGTIRNNSRIDFVERQVWTNQISGNHFVNLFADNENMDQTEINWHAVYARADRDAPLRRNFLYIYDDVFEVFRFSTRTDGNRTSFGALDDTTYEAGINIVQPSYVSDRQVDFKFGFNYIDKERNSAFRRYAFQAPAGANLELRERIPEIILGPVNIDPAGFRLFDFTDSSDFFTATLENVQAYGSFDAEINPRLRAAFGLRYENSEQFTATIDRTTDLPVQVTLNGEYLLPAGTLTYELIENMQLRLAYSQTISRPDLRELSSANFLDPDLDRPVRGNPFLQITDVDNYDIRWEWYFASGEAMTVGVFYKEFDNPIERNFQILGEGPVRSYANAQSAKLKGIEAELEKILPFENLFEGDWTNGKEFYLKANGAYIDSEITLDPAISGQQTDSMRPLQGQSDFLFNASFGFDDLNNNQRFSINLNVTGDRIADVGLFGAPNVVEKPPVLLSIAYSRDIPIGGGVYELTLRANNLLNDDYLLVQGDRVAEQYDLGVSFSIGISRTF